MQPPHLESPHLDRRNGGYYVKGTRISLDSVAWGLRRGETPEEIQDNFPSLTLQQVRDVVAFCHAHQAEVDAYLEESERLWQQMEREATPPNPDLSARIERARKELAAKRS